MLYAYPKLERTGLANMLFPWARAEVFARDRRCGMLAPDWTHLARVGPWFRSERDKRYYLNCFTSAGYVRGLPRAWILATHHRVGEADAAGDDLLGRGTVVEFRGMDGLFKGLEHDSKWLRSRLERITHPRLKADLDSQWPVMPPFIAAHVRRGDFGPWTPGTTASNLMCVRLPLDWFAAAIHWARARHGELPVIVFSDGRPDELDPLTRLPGVSLARHAPAIVHLLAISNASCIITSASSFSMWAAYLSRGPAVWFPGVTPCPRLPDVQNHVSGFGIA